jgi:hypothetical protein
MRQTISGLAAAFLMTFPIATIAMDEATSAPHPAMNHGVTKHGATKPESTKHDSQIEPRRVA